MKNRYKIALAVIAFMGITSCTDEDNLRFSEPVGSFKIVTPLSGEAVVLNETTPSNPGISLTWEAMDYTTPTEVTYTVQLAPNGSDFSDAQDLTTTTSKFATIPSNQLNLAVLIAGGTPFVQSPIDIRIKATTGTTGTQPTYSDTITYLVTAYGCLGQYAVGAGIPSAGWGWDTPLSLVCDDNVLTATANFANDAFRIFTTAGDWGSGRNYPYYVTEGYKITTNFVNAADGDQNFRFTGTPGTYRFKIDANKMTITAFQGTTAANSLWLVGAATPGGWSWAGDNETELGLISNGIYEVPLNLVSGETFRVFTQNDGTNDGNWGSGRNFPWYLSNGYTIDSDFANAADGDSNFRYTGPTGVRVLKIDSVAKTITLD